MAASELSRREGHWAGNEMAHAADALHGGRHHSARQLFGLLDLEDLADWRVTAPQ
jgi:hypothetical protein